MFESARDVLREAVWAAIADGCLTDDEYADAILDALRAHPIELRDLLGMEPKMATGIHAWEPSCDDEPRCHWVAVAKGGTP